MKKIFCSMIVTIACLSSCSDFDKTNEFVLSDTSQKSVETFSALNDSLMSLPHQGNYVMTRWGWGNFKRGIALAGADFAGACGGVVAAKGAAAAFGLATGGTGALITLGVAGLLCGASASILAESDLPQAVSANDVATECAVLYQTTSFVFEETSTSTSINYIELEFPAEYEYLNVLGGMHNYFVEQVKSTSATPSVNSLDIPVSPVDPGDPDTPEGPVGPNDPIPGATTVAVSQGTMEMVSAEEYEQCKESIRLNETYTESANQILVDVVNSCDENGFDSNKFWESCSVDISANEEVVQRYYSDILSEYVESMEDVIMVANEYIRTIDSMTTITADEKENLFLMIAVSVNSIYYWSNHL